MRPVGLLVVLLAGWGLMAGEPVLGLWTFGSVDASLVEEVRKDLEARLNCRVRVMPVQALPEAAYYPPRRRYRAERLLGVLESLDARGLDRRVALTAEDISTTKVPYTDWGIFGLASLGGPGCIVSTFRLKGGREQRLERILRVVRHEVMHTFGLDHCPTEGCLLEDAKGTIASVDRGEGSPCRSCRILAPGIWR